jgi:peptide methionine sulfoxide reductase MsrB
MQVLIVLIQQWLNDSRALSQWSSRTESRSMSMSMTSDMFHDEPANKRHSYQVINSTSLAFPVEVYH